MQEIIVNGLTKLLNLITFKKFIECLNLKIKAEIVATKERGRNK